MGVPDYLVTWNNGTIPADKHNTEYLTKGWTSDLNSKTTYRLAYLANHIQDMTFQQVLGMVI